MDYGSRAKDLVKKCLNMKKIVIAKADSGHDNTVFLATTDKGDFVVRFATEDFHTLKAHVFALNKWRELGVPVPKILDIGKDYVIETRIEGSNLSKVKLSDSQKKILAKDLGMNLKLMHSIRTEKFGYIDENGIGEMDSWKAAMEQYVSKRLRDLGSNSSVDKSIKDEVKRYILNNTRYFSIKSPRLIHKDVNAANIMVHDGIFSGIIDASDAMSGDPMFDAGIIYEMLDDESFKIFRRYYGTVDMKKVKLYAVINAMRNLKNKKNLSYHLNRLKDIVPQD